MPSADKHDYDEQRLLTRYLLGALTEEEAEPLDERSLVDEEFALRLDALEHDLVDAFVRGELSGDALERFEHFYLSSPKRAEKVEFAKALLRLEEKSASRVAEQSPAMAEPGIKAEQKVSGRSPWRWLTAPRWGLQWAFAAAALLMFFATGYLFVANERLRKQGAETQEQQASLNHRAQELEKELTNQRSANDKMLKELESLREYLSEPRVLKTIAFLFPAPTRGLSRIPTVSVPSGTDWVILRLQLESDDFPTYQAALKDSATNQILWKAAKLRPKSEGESKTVSVRVPAGLLTSQTYILELAGTPAQGGAELVTSYAFKVVQK